VKKRTANKVMPKKVECIRCGVCCILAPCCIDGSVRKDGICSYLTIYGEGYTSCKYIKKNGNIFNSGCFLRRSKEIYEYHRERAEEKVGIELIGITTITEGGMKQCVKKHTS